MPYDPPQMHLDSVVSLISTHIHTLERMRAHNNEGWIKNLLFTGISACAGRLLDQLRLLFAQYDAHFVQLSIHHATDGGVDRHCIKDNTNCCEYAHAFHESLGGVSR